MQPHRASSGFTLVELLVVIGIIAILTALVIPAFNAIGGAGNVTLGGDMLAGQLDLARQRAMAENQRIELRIWQMPATSGGGLEWRATQIFRLDTGAAIEKPEQLPQGTRMLQHDSFSSLLSSSNPYAGVGTVGGQPNRQFKSVRFRPDGSTELPQAVVWTATVVPSNSTPTQDRPADNFATVQVDPITGRVSLHRP